MPISQEATLSCFDVANYFLSLVEDETEDLISNLKLQKLCYYAQGFHIALYNRILFPERIEAWTHGPVIPDLYRKYSNYKWNSIPAPAELDLDMYANDVKDLLNEIWAEYGQYSAWALRNITHDEPPWKDAINRANNVITHSELKNYFSTQIVE